MKTGIILLALIAVALASNVHRQFAQFQRKYGKAYDSEEEFQSRFSNFKANLARNKVLARANPKATFGINQFSDLSAAEFSERYLMNVDTSAFVRPAPLDATIHRTRNVAQCSPNADNFNWQDCGATTPVYNQGQCGSCWAFSATETIESYYYLATGNLVSLSVQQIVSCDTTDQGCNGGFPSNAYQYVENAGGIEAWSSFPYTSEGGADGNCSFNAADVVATVTGYSSINGESGMYQQMSSSSGGPISVCVDASTWQSYTGGILTSCPDQVDHCVQAVGYANYGSSQAYWVVRNSWGASWGNNGLIYIAIGQDLCAIGDYATVVTASS